MSATKGDFYATDEDGYAHDDDDDATVGYEDLPVKFARSVPRKKRKYQDTKEKKKTRHRTKELCKRVAGFGYMRLDQLYVDPRYASDSDSSDESEEEEEEDEQQQHHGPPLDHTGRRKKPTAGPRVSVPLADLVDIAEEAQLNKEEANVSYTQSVYFSKVMLTLQEREKEIAQKYQTLEEKVAEMQTKLDLKPQVPARQTFSIVKPRTPLTRETIDTKARPRFGVQPAGAGTDSDDDSKSVPNIDDPQQANLILGNLFGVKDEDNDAEEEERKRRRADDLAHRAEVLRRAASSNAGGVAYNPERKEYAEPVMREVMSTGLVGITRAVEENHVTRLNDMAAFLKPPMYSAISAVLRNLRECRDPLTRELRFEELVDGVKYRDMFCQYVALHMACCNLISGGKWQRAENYDILSTEMKKAYTWFNNQSHADKLRNKLDRTTL